MSEQLITAQEVRVLQETMTMDKSEEYIVTINRLINEQLKSENSFIIVSIRGYNTRESMIKKLQEVGYDILVLDGPNIRISWYKKT